jgi:hypothetical protein
VFRARRSCCIRSSRATRPLAAIARAAGRALSRAAVPVFAGEPTEPEFAHLFSSTNIRPLPHREHKRTGGWYYFIRGS